MTKKKSSQSQYSCLQSIPPPITDNDFESDIWNSLLIPDLLELDELDEREYQRREDDEDDFDALDLLEPSLLLDTNDQNLDSHSDSSISQSTKPLTNLSKITPNQLSLIINYKQTDNQIDGTQMKKRTRKPLSHEYKQRRNQKRRLFHRIRVVTSEFSTNFMLMAANVFNSCDIKFFGSFLNTFFDVNMMYSASVKTPDRFILKYSGRGSDKLYNNVNDGYQTSPDVVYTIRQSKYQYDPHTKQTIITSRMRCDSTRTMIITGAFSQIMTKLQALANSFQFISSNVQQLDEENQETSPSSSTGNQQYTSLYFNEDDPWIDIEAFKGLLNCKRLYSAIQQIISLPDNTKASLLPWFPSGLKLTSEYFHRFYISEHGKVQHLEIFLETMKLQISKHDLIYYDESYDYDVIQCY